MELEAACWPATAQVGLRSVVEKKPDAYGRSLRFLLNGEPAARAPTTSPATASCPRHPRDLRTHDPGRGRRQHEHARVWGGGICEDDFFYELCDREHPDLADFMYACAVYPAEGALLEHASGGCRQRQTPAQPRACVVYWCGNNENQDSWLSGWKYDVDKVDRNTRDHHLKHEEQYYRMLAQVVAEYAPDMVTSPPRPSRTTAR